MKTYSVTFDVVTPESAENGAFAESGFVREATPFDEDDDIATQAADAIESYCGHVEANMSGDTPTAYYGSDGDVDYSTGAETRNAVHLDGLTAAELREVRDALKRKGLLQ